MILTKEIIFHMAAGGVITGAIFAILFGSGSMVLDEIEMTVFPDATLLEDHILLSYIIQNTGDYNIENVTVSIPDYSYTKTLVNSDSSHLIQTLDSEEFFDIVPVSDASVDDYVVVQFDAYSKQGYHDVDIMTVRLK